MGSDNVEIFMEQILSLVSLAQRQIEVIFQFLLSAQGMRGVQIIFYIVTVWTAQRALKQWQEQKRFETIIDAFVITTHFKLLVDTLSDISQVMYEKSLEDTERKADRSIHTLSRYALGIQKLALATQKSSKLIYQFRTEVIPIVEATLGEKIAAEVRDIPTQFEKLHLPDEYPDSTNIEDKLNRDKHWVYMAEFMQACSQNNLLKRIYSLSQRLDAIKAKLLEYTKV